MLLRSDERPLTFVSLTSVFQGISFEEKAICIYLISTYDHLLALMLIFNACVKTDPGLLNGVIPPISDPPTTGTGTPLITMVGTPVGNPVSKSIGPAGSALISDDGLAELNIPAGALSSNTNISIQSVTNEIQGAIGLSYHLMPDGTKFANPVSLIFHWALI